MGFELNLGITVLTIVFVDDNKKPNAYLEKFQMG
jgi:hypothetical protein